jgi:membrane-associated phospholipid phosphatase
MIDVKPTKDHPIAYWIGRLFHPAMIAVPTLIIILQGFTLIEIIGWTSFITGIVVVPGLLLVRQLEKQERYTYQRRTRDVLYITAFLCTLLCLLLLNALKAPQVLSVCVAALSVWIPVQFLINRYFTKISTHAAVAAGCGMGLYQLGHLPTPLLQAAILLLILLVCLARIITRNHTVVQVALGAFVGGGIALVVFSLLL